MLYNLIIRLKCNKCKKGYIWCIDGDFMSPSKFNKSNILAYGYALTDNKAVRLDRSMYTYSWYNAESYCNKCRNDGKSGYFPNKDELKLLYDSIMSGKMKADLITAGIYDECNYREESADGWGYIRSRSEYYGDAYVVNYSGDVYYSRKSSNGYIIPFFKF